MKTLDRCPICAGSKIEWHFAGLPVRERWCDGRHWEVWRCKQCTHAFCNPQLSAGELTEYYVSSYAAYDPEHGVESFKNAVRAAKMTGEFRHTRIRRGMRILDVGCGGGLFLRVVRELGAEIFGVEPSEHGVKVCIENHIPIFHGTVTDFLSTDPERFDVITCNHVLEHHSEPVMLLREMSRLKRDKGKIWIAVPNADCIFSKVLRDKWHSSDLPAHLQHFSLGSIELAAKLAGLTVLSLRTESAGSVPYSIGEILRHWLLVPRKLGVSLARLAVPKGGVLERRINGSMNGEAILVWMQ